MKTFISLIITFIFCLAVMNSVTAQVGSNDASFDPGTGANGTVISSLVQADGKIVLGGSFTNFNGTALNRIVRLTSTGSIDASFNVGNGFPTTSAQVNEMLLQSDGDIMAVGKFLTYNSVSRNRVVRINSDGSVDAAFNPAVGANNNVNAITRQSDGKYIIGGEFTFYASTSRGRITRVNTTGTIDNTFNTGTGANGFIYALDMQSDGSVLVGGAFSSFNGTAQNRITRLSSTGVVDGGFNIGTGAAHSSTTAIVRDIKVLSNGKILVTGSFTSFNGAAAGNIVQLNSDGTIDGLFNSSGAGANSVINNVSVQTDGKIIIAGGFTTYNGVSRNRVARLNPDGTLDTSFDPGSGSNGITYCTSIQSDGNIILGGNMTSYYGVSRTRVARIYTCPTPTISVLSQTNTTCNGSSNGAAEVTVTGGSSFTYTWLPSGGNSSSASGLAAGTYTCSSSNQCGLSSSQNITITQPTAVSATAAGGYSLCLGDNYNLSTSASGGTAPYTYTWMPGNLVGALQSTNPISTTVYTVTASDANGCLNSATQTASVINCPGPVLTGTSCGAALTSLDQLLYWTSTNGATNYRLQIICSAQSFTTVNVRNNGSVNNFKMSWISGIQYGRTYTIRVSAYIAGTWQAYGNACNVVTPNAVTIPTTQFNPSSCNVTLSSLNQALSFAPVTGATNYRLEIVNSAQSFTNVNTRNNTLTSFQMSWVSGIQYGRTYDVRIAAYLNSAWQSYGSVCQITTPTTIPLTQLTATVCNTSVASRSTIFKFDPVVGATNYQLKLVNTASSFTATNVRNSTSTNFALSYVTNTQVGATYDVQVAAYVGGVWASYGSICQVTALAAKGDNEFVNSETYRLNKGETTILNDDFKFSVWPNPTNGKLTIEVPEYSLETKVEIVNTLGQVVFNSEILNYTNEFDLGALNSGIYIVKLQHKGKVSTTKILKQ